MCACRVALFTKSHQSHTYHVHVNQTTPGVNSSGSNMANITSVGANNQPTPRVSVTGSSFSWPASKSVDGDDKSPESQESKTETKIKSADAMDTT